MPCLSFDDSLNPESFLEPGKAGRIRTDSRMRFNEAGRSLEDGTMDV